MALLMAEIPWSNAVALLGLFACIAFIAWALSRQ